MRDEIPARTLHQFLAVRREYLQDILKAGLTARLVASYRKLFFTRRLVEGDSTRNQTGYNFIIWQ